MSKQTAVDLIYHRAISLLPMGSIDARQKLKQTYERAKEMEKEQIISAFNNGEFFPSDYYHPNSSSVDGSETYYNETYGENN